MALLHKAQLSPTKLEVLNAWVPTQPWYHGGTAPDFQRIASYRFDDPAGKVGLETLLISSGDGPVFQVPVTYREAPLPGGEQSFIGTMDHSVLGQRWVYDACGDPVYATELARTILTGGSEAEQHREVDGVREVVAVDTFVAGSGMPGTDVPALGSVTAASDDTITAIRGADLGLVVLRRLDRSVDTSGAQTLTGTWGSNEDSTVLAFLR